MDTERTITFDHINELKAKADKLHRLADDARNIAEEALNEYRKARKEYMLSCLPSDFSFHIGCKLLYEETYRTTNGFVMKKCADVEVIDIDNKDEVDEYPVYITVWVIDTEHEFTFRVNEKGETMYNNIKLEYIPIAKGHETH